MRKSIAVDVFKGAALLVRVTFAEQRSAIMREEYALVSYQTNSAVCSYIKNKSQPRHNVLTKFVGISNKIVSITDKSLRNTNEFVSI